jgi:hypothetical protein
LEKIRNSSATVREIHELEILINQYKERQSVAEEKKRVQEKQLVDWAKEQETEIESLRKKKEEVYVMMHIEKIEGKKDVENLRALIDKYGQRVEWEKSFSEKASKLADQDEFPIFHKPVVLPCPVVRH